MASGKRREDTGSFGNSARAEAVDARLHHYTILVYHGGMALNLKNPDVERLAGEIAALTGESKTEAIRRALEERHRRLRGRPARDRRARVINLLRTRIWPSIPKNRLGRRLTQQQEDAILGYGPDGV
jgi:antitoxin VapB